MSVPPSRRFSSPLFRLLGLLLLMLALLVPLGMIDGVVNERAARRVEAVADVTSHWGGAQALVGPVLHVGCWYRRETRSAAGVVEERWDREALLILPERLDIEGSLASELRHRGIFTVPVYAAALKLTGRFAKPVLAMCPNGATRIDQRLDLVVGLSEPRSLRAEAGLTWNGEHVDLKPATNLGGDHLLRSGVHAVLAEPFAGDTADFTLVLGFNGADRLRLAPLGKQTSASLSSDWPHPAFQGASLPLRHDEDARGFRASWSVSYLGRDFAQTLGVATESFDALGRSLFGVDLATPADPYVQALRISRYAVLTLVFTFATLWLMEMLTGTRVHAIQYGFVGTALCLFSLLQISFAEHFGFDVAFVVAAGAVLGQVVLYSYTLLHSVRRSLAVAGVLGGLYGYLYAILKAEDYALLGGSLALFALLSAAMYLTRRVDWSRGAVGDAPVGADGGA